MILNHTIEALMERRSVREYRAEQISDEELSDILVAAKFAPSSYGNQERHMTVIQNKKFLEEIVKATERENERTGKQFAPGHRPFYNAPTVIVFSAPENSEYAHEDVAFAGLNLMTAAFVYGLGTCYIGSLASGLRAPEIMRQLDLPEGYVPIGCVAVGYASEHPPEAKPRREDDVNYIL